MEAAMAEAGGNRSKAAKKLGLSRSSFYRRLKELGLG
jgi:transcriptional regulator of acetoin/glycerol metabolism